MRRLIVILVALGVTLLSQSPIAAVKIKTSRELPRVVQLVKHKVVHPFWYVPANIMRMWYKVNICEEGGRWNIQGPIYSGGLGVRNINWVEFGGLRLSPNAALATPMQQVFIARKIEGSNYVPDQYGCGQGW